MIPVVTGSLKTLRSDQAAIVKKKHLKTVYALQEAILNGTLVSYLKNAKPNTLAKRLSLNWCQTPYITLLQICNAEMARALLARLCIRSSLCNNPSAIETALKVFNTPERLSILIEALRQGRDPHQNSINVKDLIFCESLSLPRWVQRAIEIEFTYHPDHIAILSKEVMKQAPLLCQKMGEPPDLAKQCLEERIAQILKDPYAAADQEHMDLLAASTSEKN